MADNYSSSSPAPALEKTSRLLHHGVVRGLDSTMESPMFEGRFGRMFRSFLRQAPDWTPEPSFLNKDQKFGMAELIKQAIKQ
jgi:hypothetical protein